jgi:hypothetical protein
VVSATPRPLYHREKDPVPIVQEAGWAPEPVRTCTENLASTRIRSPDRSTRSESLYRLNYRGSKLSNANLSFILHKTRHFKVIYHIGNIVISWQFLYINTCSNHCLNNTEKAHSTIHYVMCSVHKDLRCNKNACPYVMSCTYVSWRRVSQTGSDVILWHGCRNDAMGWGNLRYTAERGGGTVCVYFETYPLSSSMFVAVVQFPSVLRWALGSCRHRNAKYFACSPCCPRIIVKDTWIV